MSDFFFQLPPDSTGKRSTAVLLVGLAYTSETGDGLGLGEVVVGGTSGVAGTIVRKVPDSGTPTSGLVDIIIDVDTTSTEFSNGEALIVGGSTVATASGSGTGFYTQKTALAGANNPFNQAFVDAEGALYVRNAEGSPQYDAFGLSRTSQPTVLSDVTFYYGKDEDVQDTTSGNGVITSDVTRASMHLSTGGTTAGDFASLTTNMYHRYQPGMGQMSMMTVSLGDTSKTGLRRRWGYFESQDGLFFEIDTDGTFYVVQRASVTGSVVEQKVAREGWNGDRVDGAGGLRNLSQLDLDVENTNVYWIDFGWLGAARTRFGVFDDGGSRITMHTFQNANNDPRPFMRQAQLPVRAEIENVSATGSPSSMYVTCMSVQTDGRVIPDKKRRSVKQSKISPQKTGITAEVPVFSIRASLLFNTIVNRKISLPEFFSFNVVGDAAIFRLRKNGSLTGASFSSASSTSSSETDTSATAITGGEEIVSWMLDPGSHNIDAPENFGIQGQNLILQADGTYGDILTVTCETLGTSTDARVGMTWIDIK